MAGMENSSRRSFLCKLSAAVLATQARLPRLFASAPGSLVFVGVYTNKHSTSRGIYAFRWDADEGTLSPLGLAAATTNPSFLTLAPDRRHLYAVNEIDDYQGKKSGSLSSFSLEGESGKLKAINVVASGGSGPCNIATDFTGKSVFAANYDSGSAASYQIKHNAGLSKAVSHFQYEGHGADPKRQTGPHAHCTTVSPDNRYVLVNDLGLDRISVYHLDPHTAKLTANDPPFYEAMPGSGPRSFTFHPSGKWAYSLNEIASTVDALAWDAARGTLTRLQNISTLAEDFKGMSTAATVAIDGEGRYLYASNRGEDSIAVFAISDRDGTLKLVQSVPCGGKAPRHFALDPGNQWVVVANQDSASMVVFARNARTGHLKATGKEYSLDFPVCVLFRK
jgi:6-phosphogluconolactonase